MVEPFIYTSLHPRAIDWSAVFFVETQLDPEGQLHSMGTWR